MSLAPHALTELLTQAVARQASDLHLSAGLTPKVRVHGQLTALTAGSAVPLTHETLMQLLAECMNDAQYAQLKQGNEVDFAFAVSSLGRFRANAFLQQHGCSAVMRHIPSGIPTLTTLHTPAVLHELLQHVGLLLVTGPTGSGKSTTLAAMVQHLNAHTQQHIVTLEDPIEFVHTSDQCIITQREWDRTAKALRMRCAPPCARTRMSFWSVNCVIWKPFDSRSPQRKQATWFWRVCTRAAHPPRSIGWWMYLMHMKKPWFARNSAKRCWVCCRKRFAQQPPASAARPCLRPWWRPQPFAI